MCLACEQDAIWLAYLERRGLLKPDDPAAVEALFAAFPEQPLPMQPGAGEAAAKGPAKVSQEKQPSEFSCDDPLAE